MLCANTIDDYATEEQKKYLMPKLRSLEMIGGWGLTEKEVGSDASNL